MVILFKHAIQAADVVHSRIVNHRAKIHELFVPGLNLSVIAPGVDAFTRLGEQPVLLL